MPIALIKILEGRSPEKKRRLIESVSQAMATSLEMPIDGVRVPTRPTRMKTAT